MKISASRILVGGLLSMALLVGPASADPGGLDPSFDPGSGLDGPVTAMVVQTDGKIIIGGYFTTIQGLVRSRIGRLNADGSADSSFNPGAGADSSITSMALQLDGKVLIGGYFSTVDDRSRRGIARLNTDGSLDKMFNPGTVGSNYYAPIRALAVQPDGKILIGGDFSTVNGTNRNQIARLNADGSLDLSFDAVNGIGTYFAAPYVRSIALQPDGKVLVGGYFATFIDGMNLKSISRLNSDGSLDLSFKAGTGVANGFRSPIVNAIVVQPDLKLIVAGDFTSVNGTDQNFIARFNDHGSLDTNFNSGTGPNGVILCVVLQTNGDVLIGGDFTEVNGRSRNGIARLKADGSLDSSFDAGTDAISHVYSMLAHPEGRVVLAGFSCTGRGLCFPLLQARFSADAKVDNAFNRASGIDGDVYSLILQPDGKALIGGMFSTVQGTSRNSIARLDSAGRLDFSFDPGTGPDGPVSAVALQKDGRVLITGDFSAVNGISRNAVARLNADGSLDNSFVPGTSTNEAVYVSSLAVQPDGRVLIGGWSFFGLADGAPTDGIARLNPNGSLDSSFETGTGVDSDATVHSVDSIKVQPDGKVLIGGDFATFNGLVRNGVARLNPDGSVDTSFIPDTGSNSSLYVNVVVMQLDGKVLMGGGFGASNGVVRLNSNGSLDSNFNTGSGIGGYSDGPDVRFCALQSDGKVLIGGYFSTVNGMKHDGIARLNVDGSLDASFTATAGGNAGSFPYVSAIAMQPDWNVLIGGGFTIMDGQPRWRVARLWSNPVMTIFRSGPNMVLSWPASQPGFRLEASLTPLSPTSWLPLAGARFLIGDEFVITNAVRSDNQYYRLKAL